MKGRRPRSKERSAHQWRSRRGIATVVRLAAFAIPIVAGYFAGGVAASLMESPQEPMAIVLWWTVVIATAGLAAHITETFTRRLIPLSALLKLTLAFPDKAPPRYRVAHRAGGVNQLRARLEAATAAGKQDIAEAAELILTLAASLSQHDRRTRGHSERTRAYTDLLAEEMRLGDEARDRLRWAALLHDIGKLEVPAEILNKPSSLDAEEWKQIHRHPLEGMRLIAPIVGWLGPWATTIEHHHERWDGSGYPHGLAGEDIALGARIVAVADAYDVMVTGRSYKTKMSHADARAEVARHAGAQFDPRVVRALMNIALGRLRWSTGPLAALADLPLLRPLEVLGRDVATVIAAGLITATAGSANLLPAIDLVHQPVRARIEQLAEGQPTASAGGRPGGTGLSEVPTGSGPATPTPTSSTTTSASTTLPAGPTTTTSGPLTSTTTTTTTTTLPTTTTTTTTTIPGTLAALDDSAFTRPNEKVNIGVLANDSGPIVASSLSIVDAPSVGSAVVFGNGRIRYSAPPNFSGMVNFTYQVCDVDGACDTAVVSVTVN
ncbi:MAG: HD domain-containing phosphohydrolase [Actinomycetota bacterium]